MYPLPSRPLGFEKVLADLDTVNDYALLGKEEVFDDNIALDVPGLSSTAGSAFKTAPNRCRIYRRRFVQNVRGSTLLTGFVVVKDISSGSYIHGINVTTTANVKRPLIAGIVLGDAVTDGTVASPAAIADDSICDVIIYGICRVFCASGVVAGDLLGTSTTAGMADATTTADASFGYALTAAAQEGGVYYCYAYVNAVPHG